MYGVDSVYVLLSVVTEAPNGNGSWCGRVGDSVPFVHARRREELR